ncbi:anhydro-N-acetylmuramic acid kinase [Pseudonocardia sp. CA-107938]|uniref:anhydro-N-acetylmuramic acid kinase n=1 Tax=Pseudonocardia sp. CA-107938 TaxID=3240021 RepID=UPI003D8C18F4
MRVIGLMSGTSIDGIDAAAADLRLDDDLLVLQPLGAFTAPLPAEYRELVAAVLPPATTTAEAVCRLDTAVGQAFAEVAARAVDELCDGRADLVVSHGQTVHHWVDGPTARGTLQLGQPAWIAERTGLPVVADLRPRDVAAGGQGAPLVSAVDVLLLSGRPAPAAALNLGGIANVTVVAPGREPVAFDTGPANVLLDAAVTARTGAPHDADGALAARGHVHEELLARLLADPFYALPPPRTTGRERFHLPYLQEAGADDVGTPDLLATLVALTARTVSAALARYGVGEVVAAGGGTRNPTLMAALAAQLAPARLRTTDGLGLPVDAKEAYAFCVLGFLTAHGLPGTVPACTGARGPRILGSLTPGMAGFPAAGAATPPTRMVIT